VTAEDTAPSLSNRFVVLFVSVAQAEVGEGELATVLTRVDLHPPVIGKKALNGLEGIRAAEFYATFQQGLRLFYGRGARGSLLRIGRSMWKGMVAQASLVEKAELEIVRRLPVPARRRRVLEVVAERLREGGGSASVHMLDIDLLLSDRSSAATCRQSSNRSICFVTLGMIQEALVWATGQEADVEEIACKAAGAPACEFKISYGGK
jgi:predicted hydrocarbon binding protein